MDEKGERIPLTICDYDREAGTITIVVQEVGASTVKMSELKAGDSFRDFVGPLGCASEFVEEDIEELKKQKILFVAGGLGTAPVYPQVKWLHEHGASSYIDNNYLSVINSNLYIGERIYTIPYLLYIIMWIVFHIYMNAKC